MVNEAGLFRGRCSTARDSSREPRGTRSIDQFVQILLFRLGFGAPRCRICLSYAHKQDCDQSYT